MVAVVTVAMGHWWGLGKQTRCGRVVARGTNGVCGLRANGKGIRLGRCLLQWLQGRGAWWLCVLFWWAGVEVNGGALPHADYCLLAGWSRVWGMDESGCELGCVLRWALSLEYCRVLAASGAGIGVGVEKAKWSA